LLAAGSTNSLTTLGRRIIAALRGGTAANVRLILRLSGVIVILGTHFWRIWDGLAPTKVVG
jgi:hypothetical protein